MDSIRLVGTQLKSVENTTSKYLYIFFLAALSKLQDEMGDPDEFLYSPDVYDSFDNFLADDPIKKLKRPVTVMGGAKAVLASMFSSIVAFVGEAGVVQIRDVRKYLLETDAIHSTEIRFMVRVSEALKGKIQENDDLRRDFDSVDVFATRIRALVARKEYITPGERDLAKLFVNFLKSIAWFAANFSHEHKTTINYWFIRACFRNFGMMTYTDDDGEVRHIECEEDDLMEFLHEQKEYVDNENSSLKKKKPKKDTTKADKKSTRGSSSKADAKKVEEVAKDPKETTETKKSKGKGPAAKPAFNPDAAFKGAAEKATKTT